MWFIRISICLLLITYIVVFSDLRVRHLKKDERYGSNKIITRQIIIVVVYNLLCYAMVLLPPSRTTLLPYHLLQNQTTLIGFVVLGILLITCGIALSVAGVIKRKAIGGQHAPEGLVTSGVYSYFRHPIYSGIVWVCLGLALVARNLDGLLMCPAVLGVNLSAALMEERFEVGARFREQYNEYKQTVAMFGPKWIWGVIVLVILTLVVNGYVSS